jgi:hypothetical protein
MITQKIVILSIDTGDGTRVLEQIRAAAGPGPWRIVSLLDLHEEHAHWVPEPDPSAGRRVLAVLEQVLRGEAELTEAITFAEAAS